MSIEREKGHDGEITFCCDADRCNEIHETGTANFEAALADMKAAGWKVRRIAGEWMHFCPDEDE